MGYRHFLLLLLVILLAGFAGCSLFSKNKMDVNKPLLWISNASSVDFDDLYELHGEVNGPAGTAPRYEGFFDVYQEGTYEISKELQPGDCLSVQAEWLICFPEPAQVATLLDTWDEPSVNDRIRGLKVELRGMIEGKWLDVLLNENRKPRWIPASGGNNVVASVRASEGWTMTVAELDRTLKQGGELARIVVYRGWAGALPDPARELFASGFSDLVESDLIRGIRRGNREPVLSIVKAVLGQFRKRAGEGAVLQGINFSTQGSESAVLSDPLRREQAWESPLYVKSLYALGYFTLSRPIIEMRMVLQRALEEGGHCLGAGEEYLLHIYGADGQLMGEARLRLEE